MEVAISISKSIRTNETQIKDTQIVNLSKPIAGDKWYMINDDQQPKFEDTLQINKFAYRNDGR